MFRSLFIGFLILSALTSRGVGAQINQNAAISADMLLNLYNAAAYADRQAELVDPKKEGRLLRNAAKIPALQEILRSAGHDIQLAWVMPENPDICRGRQFNAASRSFQPSSAGEIYTRGSDASPPYGV